MTTQTEALKLALKALEDAARHLHPAPKQNSAITAIKEALAQQSNEQVEPVAWRAWFDADNSAKWLFTLWPEEEHPSFDWQPLYTHPPVPTEQPKEPEQPAQQEPDDALFWHRVRVHLANRNFYSHKEFCEKLEALMHETQPKQEPVAFIDMREWPPIRWRDGMVRADVSFFDGQGLFFAPPQRKPWVSLTPEKIEEINCLNILWDDGERGEIVNVKEFVEAVEAKLRELNEAPQRKPLTDEQMNQIWFEQNKTHGSVIWRFARAIEAAHGIKE